MVFTGTDLKSSLTSSTVHEHLTATWRATGDYPGGFPYVRVGFSLDRLGYRALLLVGGRPVVFRTRVHGSATPAIADICVCANGISKLCSAGWSDWTRRIKVRFRRTVPPREPPAPPHCRRKL